MLSMLQKDVEEMYYLIDLKPAGSRIISTNLKLKIMEVEYNLDIKKKKRIFISLTEFVKKCI